MVMDAISEEAEVTRSSRMGQLCAAALVAAVVWAGAVSAQATLIRGDFSGTVVNPGAPFVGPAGSTFTGYYIYDDTVASSGPAIGNYSFATGYPAVAFVIDGIPVSSTPTIAIYDGTASSQFVYDGFWVLNTDDGADGYPSLQLIAPVSTWSSDGLDVLSGVTYSDFNASASGVSRSPLELDGVLTSWEQTVVPEPGSGILLGLGLAAFGVRRGRSHRAFASKRKGPRLFR